MSNARVNILFVCLGNICRSPTAHGVFIKKLQDAELSDLIHVDSCGTGSWHVGAEPDQRTQAAAMARGYDLSDLRARKFEDQDFGQYDYILAMDVRNLADVIKDAPYDYDGKLQLFLDYSDVEHLSEVPDPYYGGRDGFDRVLSLIESASEGLVKHLQQDLIGETA